MVPDGTAWYQRIQPDSVRNRYRAAVFEAAATNS